MRSPLRAGAATIAATLALSLVLVLNIVTGLHTGPLSATPAAADFSFSDSSSEDSLISEAFSSILAGSSSSDLFFSSSSSNATVSYTTVAYSGAASLTVAAWAPSPCDQLCIQAKSNAATTAMNDFDGYCEGLNMTPVPTSTTYSDCSCSGVKNNIPPLTYTYTATATASVSGYCKS